MTKMPASEDGRNGPDRTRKARLKMRNALTDIDVQNAVPAAKPFKLYDGGGLYLIVTPSGGKWWRFNYRFDGKPNTLSMGTYPEISLEGARDRRDEARRQVALGADPSKERRQTKIARVAQIGLLSECKCKHAAGGDCDNRATRYPETERFYGAVINSVECPKCGSYRGDECVLRDEHCARILALPHRERVEKFFAENELHRRIKQLESRLSVVETTLVFLCEKSGHWNK